MPRPKRGRAVLVGNAVPFAPLGIRGDLATTDIWPRATTLAHYRMTLEQYRRMYEGQAGGCAICEAKRDPLELVIDHNHKTGKVRGLLCPGCNTGLGHLKDSPDVLEAALQYLEERGCYGRDSLSEETA